MRARHLQDTVPVLYCNLFRILLFWLISYIRCIGSSRRCVLPPCGRAHRMPCHRNVIILYCTVLVLFIEIAYYTSKAEQQPALICRRAAAPEIKFHLQDMVHTIPYGTIVPCNAVTTDTTRSTSFEQYYKKATYDEAMRAASLIGWKSPGFISWSGKGG